jgi:Tol biopolymer transport system component
MFRSVLPIAVALLATVSFAQPSGSAQTEAAPKLFAEGIVSSGKEFTVTFSPDGNDVYFTRADTEKKLNHVMHSRKASGEWKPAERVSFSSEDWSDLDPALSPDGKKMFFVSTRPAPGKNPKKKEMDIWVSSRTGSEWGAPEHITAVNSDGKEGSPSVDRQGDLYFFSDRQSEIGNNAIYVSRFKDGKYSTPERLDGAVNAGPSDTSPFISPDGSTLLFYSTREGGYGKADIYVSVLMNGKWSPAKNLGPVVNTNDFEYNASVSPDGRTLYFGRNRGIYEVPVEALGLRELDPKRFR